MTNYTWSHGIGFVSGPFNSGGGHQNARDLNADRGNSQTDVRHRYIANWLYEMPFGKGKRFLGSSSGVVNAIVGDWQVGGVLTIQSGSPFTVSGGAGRPNRTCDGTLPSGERSATRGSMRAVSLCQHLSLTRLREGFTHPLATPDLQFW